MKALFCQLDEANTLAFTSRNMGLFLYVTAKTL